jgi:hypothetical protein
MFTGGEIYGVGHAKSSGSVGGLMLSRFRNTATFNAFSMPAAPAAGMAPLFSTKVIDDLEDSLVY